MRPSFPLLNTETQKYGLLGVLFGLTFPVIATLIRIQDANLSFSLQSAWSVQRQDTLLWIIDTAPLFLGLFAALAGRRQDAAQKTYAELQTRERELREVYVTLEQRVADRTRELLEANQQVGERAQQMELIAKIAQSTVSYQELDSLLPHITELISQARDFYHVGVFLLDASKEYAILRAANSVGGARMLARGHRLKVGTQGMVGFVAARGAPRIALNVGEESVYFNNPDLPETQSEISLPLKYGSEIIGALDIQSRETNAFTQTDIEVFTILADQVSVAIQNVRSLEVTQRALREVELATGQMTGQTWRGYAERLSVKGYRFDGIKPEVLKEAERSTSETNNFTVAVQLRGQTLGRLKLKPSDVNHKWTVDEQAIIASTAERVAIALEAARLLEDAQKRATREETISQISTKLGSTFQLDSILRDTVEELGKTLKGSTVSFQLIAPSAPPTLDSESNGGAQ